MTAAPNPLWPVLLATRVPQHVHQALGPLAQFVEDPRVTDVFLLADGSVHVDTGTGVYPAHGIHISATEAASLARGLIELGGRHVDEATPVADVNLGFGLRVHVVLPPISATGALVSLRVAARQPPALDSLSLHDATEVIPALIRAVKQHRTLIISGATGSGKTTLLAGLMAHAAPTERLVVIEDLAEIQIDHPHVVSLEARQANIEGAGELGLARLVFESLRMRPQRLILGEVRGAEIVDVLQAFHTGHRGGATTVHAHSVLEVPVRLDALGALAGMKPGQLARQAVGALDLVVHVDKTSSDTRVLSFGRLRVNSKGVLGVRLVDVASL
jgi:pilus assembly protein CpaF